MKIQPKPFDQLIRERVQNRASVGFTVQNATGEKAVIRIYDVIGWPWITGQTVADELDQITADEIEVQISSIGGDVFESIAIYNALRAHPAKITTRVDSLAASGASIIAQAGDHRIMLTGAQMMIHKAWSMAWGYAEDLRKSADILDKQSDIIAGIYAERAGGKPTDFLDLMGQESWFDAAEAVEAGLADEVVKPSRVDESPQDRATAKFADRLRAAVAAAEAVAEETEKVVTFRVSQGKPPLSEDAVALLDQLTAAAERLAVSAVETPEPEPPSATDEWLKFVSLTT